MKPGSFDPATAREFVGDEHARRIESAARSDAETGRFTPPSLLITTYADGVLVQQMRVIYAEQYRKRRARIERAKADFSPPRQRHTSGVIA
jgi:hypothetical protein